MRNYEKKPSTVLLQFDKECFELCYTAAIPQKVAEAREAIKKLSPNINKMEIEKERKMHTLRNLFDPFMFRDDLYSPFDSDGEPVAL